MLTLLRQPLPQDLKVRGYPFLKAMEAIGVTQQLNLACCTLLAMYKQLAEAEVRLAGVLNRTLGGTLAAARCAPSPSTISTALRDIASAT